MSGETNVDLARLFSANGAFFFLQSVIKMNLQERQVLLVNLDQTNEPPKQFTFDAVYPEDSITETLYADSVFPLVESVRRTSTLANSSSLRLLSGSRRL